MVKNNYLGKFIVVEGPDGSGHTTQSKLLLDFLANKGFDVVLTKEPTERNETGKKIKAALKGNFKINSFELQKLFTQDRQWHLENEIIPDLKKGKIVISDRYCFSTFAYGEAEGVNLEELIRLNNSFLLPDITFILEVDPKICLERIEKRREEKEIFEKEEKLEKVLENYRKFPSLFENVLGINGNGSIEDVFEKIKEAILLKFSKIT